MINLAVINLKEVINFFKRIIIGIILFAVFVKVIGCLKNANYVKIDELKNKSVLDYCNIIEKTLIISKYYIDDKKTINESGIKKILVSELSILEIEEELMEKENQEEVIEFDNIEKKNYTNTNEKIKEEKVESNYDIEENVKVEEFSEVIQTKVITENNKTDTYTDIYKTVKIKNESKYPLTEEILTTDFNLSNTKDIIVYHTHTCESYTPTEKDNYVASGNFRTIDLNYNVARVGEELKKYLIDAFNVNHNVTYHDYPAYSGSYTRALSTIKSIVPENYSGLVIDLHRDALGSNSSYAPRVQIGEDVASQLMFVIGTDGGGLEHSNWKRNLKIAIKIQEKANEMYPGLFKPIILRNSRYNQHISDGACIIEVGATGNTLDECNMSMKYLAKVLEKILKE